MVAKPHNISPQAAQHICATVLHTSGNHNLLAETLDSIRKQNYPHQRVTVNVLSIGAQSITDAANVIETDVDGLPQKLYHILDTTPADIYVILHSGDTFFDGTLHSVNEIFATINGIDWLTGIETVSTSKSYKVIHGNTSTRRWSNHIMGKNLYESGSRYIPAAATFWRRAIWDKAKSSLNFVSHTEVQNDIWQAYLTYASPSACDVYFSSSRSNETAIALGNYSMPTPIEDGWLYRVAEYLYLNNIPYLRSFYRYANKLPQVVRFDHKTQSYFLSDY